MIDRGPIDRRRDLFLFCALACAFSWLDWGLVLASARGRLPIHVPLNPWGSFGPAFAAIVVTALRGGAPRLRSLCGGLLAWRFPGWLWLVVVFGPPVLVLLGTALFAALGGTLGAWQAPAVGELLFLAILLLFVGGPLGEEIGWRGYLLPQLLARMSPVAASFAVAGVWAVWHLPLFWVPGATQEGGSIPLFAALVAGVSILTTWVYIASGGSLLAAILFHHFINLATWFGASIQPALDSPGFGRCLLLFTWVAAAGALWQLRKERGLMPQGAAPAPGAARTPREALTPAGGSDLSTGGNNGFALALYDLVRRKPGNIFMSPFSVRTVLAIAWAGARGETGAQMGRALRFAAPGEAVHDAIAGIAGRLAAGGGGKYDMAVANSLWCQEGAPLRKEFLDLVARHHGAGVHPVDFRGAPEAARVAINGWVGDRTKERIRDLIPAGAIDPLTALVLANAVYFKAPWALKFMEDLTVPEPFHLEGGAVVTAPLMRQWADVRYLQGAGFQAVDLDYEGGELSMLVLLPDRRDGLRDLEGRATARRLDEWVGRMEERRVAITLPRFRMTWGTVDLADRLAELGMPIAFNRARADFSGINGHQPPDEEALYLSKVFHKAFVEVTEEGTEAAAATAALVDLLGAAEGASPPAPVFRADHPFMFAIRDRVTGSIVFLGRVADPTSEG